MSHNSIAKDAYWNAINNGATHEQARRSGVDAVEAYLLTVAKKKEKKILTPEPNPDPIDLGPHPSGSMTMEHGQTLPNRASFVRLSEQRYEKNAWRCDINHAFGRYYMAGDVKSCQGCGSCRNGSARQTEMDFYLPIGTVVRQKASDLVKWRPRKAYNRRKKGKNHKQGVTHNQITSKHYWDLVAQGHRHVEGSFDIETLALAMEAAEQQIDTKIKAACAELEEGSLTHDEDLEGRTKVKHKRTEQHATAGKTLGPRRGQDTARHPFLRRSSCSVLRKRKSDDLDSSEL